MNTADFFVLGGCLLGFFAIMAAHELRAIRRDERAQERHATVIKAVNDARALFLGARQEVGGIRSDVDDLKVRAADLDFRVSALESGRSAH
jgi:ribose 5-phosphate isomerase RpiB